MPNSTRKAIESVFDDLSMDLAATDQLASELGAKHPLVVALYESLEAEASTLFEGE